MEVLDPITEAEAYLAGASYSHAEETLKEAIANDPSRLDLKMKLLEVYEHSGNETAFRTLADKLRQALEEAGGKSQLEVSIEGGGLAGDETLAGDNSLVHDAITSTTPTPVNTQQKKIDSDTQTAVRADSNERLIEWEPIERPTASATTSSPTAAQGERQIEAPQQCGAATSTLKEAFTDFLHARKTLKPRTIEDYKRLMAVAFADWQGKPLLEISAEMITKRHQELSEDRSAAYANRAMRFLRTLFNFALARHRGGTDSLVPENPVRCL